MTETFPAMKFERILLATDFTPASEAATAFAIVLAKRFESDLVVVYVVDLSVATASETAVVGLPVDEMRETSTKQMERTLGVLSAAGVRAQGHTLEARNVGAAIIGLSKQIKTDLIVVGAHGRHGLSRLMVGSISGEMIHHAECPVFVLGPNVVAPKDGNLWINTIVFATDLKHDTEKKAAVALRFAKDNVAKIYLCHVMDKEGKDISETVEMEFKAEEALQGLVPQSTYDWCGPECVVTHGRAGEQIVALADRVSADLIVLGARRSGSWFIPLVEGAVEEVISRAVCPVLTICTD